MMDDESDLRLLAAAYLHQDFRRQFADEEAAVRRFVRNEGSESAEHAAAEITDVLSRPSDEEHLRHLWKRVYGGAFSPALSNMTYRAWFERMLDILREPVDAAATTDGSDRS